MNRFNLAQNSIQWWAVMNMIMNTDFVKSWQLFEQLSDCQLLQKDSAAYYFSINNVM
jgi:hypothetical protein